MAWKVNWLNISMVENDFGIELPMTINGVTFGAQDSVKLTIKDANNGNTVLEKTFSDISDNTIGIVLTSAESELFTVGSYVYCLDWYQDNVFLCNIIESATFTVVDKA